MALPTVGAVFGVFFAFVVKHFVIHFFYVENNGPERMSVSSQTF